MAPIEDLHSRDLAWISEFVMQQMMIMLRPMMDHLQQTDMTVEYAQRSVQRLCVDISEVRGDIERTNKYLGILRQGLGVQNESKCMLQRGVDSTTRTAKRLDDQMDSMLGVIRGMEESIRQVSADVRGAGAKHEELAKLVAEKGSSMETLQAKLERVSNDTHSMKDGFLSSEARLEVWQRELRELRRSQLGMVPKLEDKTGRPPPSSRGCGAVPTVPDSWPQKKPAIFPTAPVADLGGGPAASVSSSNCAGSNVNDSCGAKRPVIGRLGSKGRAVQQDLDVFAAAAAAPPSRSSNKVYENITSASEFDDVTFGTGGFQGPAGAADEAAPSSSRLPLLATKQSGVVTRPSEGSYSTAPRLRFSETMVKPPSRGISPG
jgi:hypothetical protein